MSTRTLQIEPSPDFTRLQAVLTRASEPDRVPFFELFSNIEAEVLTALGLDDDAGDSDLERHITYMHRLGYDYVNVRSPDFRFAQKERPRAMTAEGERTYLTGELCTIAGRDDFETYAWPDMGAVDYSRFEAATTQLPEGMKVIPMGPGGVLENAMWLLGYEGISYHLFDNPRLVGDVFDAVGSRIEEYFDKVAAYDAVGAVVLGDDMGFRTQTLLSPAVFREYVFPWHARLVAAIHRHGKPAILHACGNLSEVMDDIIACGWDAKHSFEDAIEPVWEQKRGYGDRIALLGGFDMDKLCRMAEDEVRAHTRLLLERTAPGGGWALGTGNSVANYVPLNNYLAMLEEGFAEGIH